MGRPLKTILMYHPLEGEDSIIRFAMENALSKRAKVILAPSMEAAMNPGEDIEASVIWNGDLIEIRNHYAHTFRTVPATLSRSELFVVVEMATKRKSRRQKMRVTAADRLERNLEWARAYEAGATLEVIGQEAGVHPVTVSVGLRNVGVEIRSQGARPTQKPMPEEPIPTPAELQTARIAKMEEIAYRIYRRNWRIA